MKLTLIFIFTGILLSANAQSTVGNWSKKDKRKANKVVKAIDKELDVLGDQKQAYIDCYLEKVENNYESFQAADSDYKGCEMLAMECAKGILGVGVKTGNEGAKPSTH